MADGGRGGCQALAVEGAAQLAPVEQEEGGDVDADDYQRGQQEQAQVGPEVEPESGEDDDVDRVADRQQERCGIGDERAGEHERQHWKAQARHQCIDNGRQDEGGGVV